MLMSAAWGQVDTMRRPGHMGLNHRSVEMRSSSWQHLLWQKYQEGVFKDSFKRIWEFGSRWQIYRERTYQDSVDTIEDVNMNPFLVFLFLFEVIGQSCGLKPIDVYWNISNPIFSGGGFGSEYVNVIELNKDKHPWEYDQVSRQKIYHKELFCFVLLGCLFLYINGIHSFSLTLDILKHSTRYSTWQKATFIPLIFPRFNKGEARSFHPKIHHEDIFTLSTRFFTWGNCIVKLIIKIIVLRKSQIKIINEQYIFFYFESHLNKIEFN